MDSDPRALTVTERAVLDKLLEVPFRGRDLVRQQVDKSLVREWDDGSRTLSFEIGRSKKPPHTVAVEAEFSDDDGNTAHVLLHLREETVYELEFFKEVPGPVLTIPTPDRLRILR